MSTAVCRDCGARFKRDADEAWKVRCLPCWVRLKAATEASATPVADPIRAELRERLRELLMLCHPDKHAGSALATRTTQWLLSLRDRRTS
jgi:hypothetical protein